MQELKLSPASYKDIQTISQLAEIIWNQHYRSIISQQQINYMLGKMYDADSLREQMEQKGHRFYLILINDQPIGFISVNPETDGAWFLNKFYVNQLFAARGIGSAAFDQLCAILQPTKITLTVNRQNFKSINFYFKKGFRIDHVADFDIGDGYVMNDFVMVKTFAEPQPSGK